MEKDSTAMCVLPHPKAYMWHMTVKKTYGRKLKGYSSLFQQLGMKMLNDHKYVCQEYIAIIYNLQRCTVVSNSSSFNTAKKQGGVTLKSLDQTGACSVVFENTFLPF